MRIRSAVSHTAHSVGQGALVALLVAGLAAGTTFAAKGGGGGHHGGGLAPGATVGVSPNPVSAFSSFAIAGCGYTPGAGVQFSFYAPDGARAWAGTVDGTGCLTNAEGWANSSGTAKLDVVGGGVTVVASTSFTIQ